MVLLKDPILIIFLAVLSHDMTAPHVDRYITITVALNLNRGPKILIIVSPVQDVHAAVPAVSGGQAGRLPAGGSDTGGGHQPRRLP